MFRSQSAKLMKPVTSALRGSITPPLLRPYSSSTARHDALGWLAGKLSNAVKAPEPSTIKVEEVKKAEPKPAPVKVESKPTPKRVLTASPKVSSLNRAKAEEHEQLLALRSAQKEADIRSESDSSITSRVSKAYQYKYGLESASAQKLAEVLESGAGAPMHMRFKELVKVVLEEFSITEEDINALLMDPFTCALGEGSELVPVARHDKADGKRAIVESMELWPSEYYVDRSHYAQVKQTDPAPKDALECLFSINDYIALVDGRDLDHKVYPFIGAGYIGPEGEKLPLKAVLFEGDSGRLQSKGDRALISKLEAGAALRHAQVMAKIALMLKGLEIYLSKNPTNRKPITISISVVKKYLNSPHAELTRPVGMNTQVTRHYNACMKIIRNANLKKSIMLLDEESETRPASATIFKDSSRVKTVETLSKEPENS